MLLFLLIVTHTRCVFSVFALTGVAARQRAADEEARRLALAAEELHRKNQVFVSTVKHFIPSLTSILLGCF
jgi:hypothetical protein